MAEARSQLGDHVFVSNVGGAGMSAVAVLLAERGHRVSGHDPAEATPYLAQLQALGVAVTTGAAAVVLAEDVSSVVVSTATPEDAPEVVEAARRGIPVLHRSIALAELCGERATVAVAGTHGKSTTSAMLATILVATGRDPGWVVGAPIPGLGRSAAWGGDGPLVVEADESDGTFLKLPAEVAVVTNVEPDHIEHYGDFATLVGAFEQFLAAAKRVRIISADDAGARGLAAAEGATTVGCADDASVRVTDLRVDDGGMTFTLVREGAALTDVHLPVPGVHNACNAAVAVTAADAFGVPPDEAAKALASFGGVTRRVERRGTAQGALLLDDYGHLPGEIAVAIEAARQLSGRRVICVFQPHRYSRTATLWREFADAFLGADRVAITDIYSAGEAPRLGVTGKLIVDAVLDAHPWADIAYLPHLNDVVRWLRAVLRPGDVCLTVGAGDIWKIPGEIADPEPSS